MEATEVRSGEGPLARGPGPLHSDRHVFGRLASKSVMRGLREEFLNFILSALPTQVSQQMIIEHKVDIQSKQLPPATTQARHGTTNAGAVRVLQRDSYNVYETTRPMSYR